jgi:hypothetical protein
VTGAKDEREPRRSDWPNKIKNLTVQQATALIEENSKSYGFENIPHA